MMKKWSKSKQRLIAFLMGLSIIVLIVLSAEWFLSTQGQKPAYQISQIGGWVMMPHEKNRRMQSPQGHDFLMTTNADGLRSSLSTVKQSPRFRIAILGDSTVFGWGVNDEDSFPSQLETALASSFPSVEVLNAAQPGHSSTQAAEVFRHIVSAYQPDLSILFLPEHDHNRVLVSDREVLRGGDHWQSQLRVFLARRSALYSWLRHAIFPRAKSLWVFPDQEHSEPRVPRVSDSEREENILEMRSTAASWEGVVWIGLFPSHYDLDQERGAPPKSRFGSQWIKEIHQQHQIPFFELRNCCGPDGDALVFPYDRGHLNAQGCQVVAAAAAEKLHSYLSAQGMH